MKLSMMNDMYGISHLLSPLQGSFLYGRQLLEVFPQVVAKTLTGCHYIQSYIERRGRKQNHLH